MNYANILLSVSDADTFLPKKICKKKLKSPHPNGHVIRKAWPGLENLSGWLFKSDGREKSSDTSVIKVGILTARFSCSVAPSVKCYFTIYLHGESLSEQLTNATIQLKVRSKLHQRQQRLKHLHRLPNAITTLVILNPLLHGY